MDSDDASCRHCLDDVERPWTCHIVHPVKTVRVPVVVAVRPHRSVRLAGDVALPRWGRTVAGGSDFGGGGDKVEVVDDGGREGKKLFVYDVYVSFRQTPLTRLSIKTQRLAYVNILSNPVPFCLYILDTSFRPAPTARTSQARPCLRCRSQLAGGKPPGPPGTHA